jgi:signal transduction histidine kinase
LINDLMVFARPRALRLETIDLQRLVTEAIALVRRDPAGAHVDVSVAGDSVVLQADAELLRNTILNLLLNAAQALDGRGRIIVRTAITGQSATVDVQDDGPGISADIQARVLEPFFTTKARGGGLGLPIAKRTAELHGGSLTLTCPAAGGTVMTLSLPVRPAVSVPD